MAKKTQITIISNTNPEEEEIFLKTLKADYCRKNNHVANDLVFQKFHVIKGGFSLGITKNNKTIDTFIILKKSPNYLDKKDLCDINMGAQSMFEEEGIYGVGGVREDNLLSSIPVTIQMIYFGHDNYPTIFKKCAYLWYSLAKDHCFVNGNKRTALLASAVFLQMNGYSLLHENGPDDLYKISIKIADGTMEIDCIEKYIEENVIIDMEAYKDYITAITESD